MGDAVSHDDVASALQAIDAQKEKEYNEVQAFKTQEDALRFVMECQPVDYQPIREEKEDFGAVGFGAVLEEPFPKWETGREAFEWVVEHMKPWPTEFVSVSGEFKRRLRIREATAEEQKKQQEQDIHKAVASSSLVRTERRSRMNMARSTLLPKVRAAMASGTLTAHTKEVKPWLVEAAGKLF